MIHHVSVGTNDLTRARAFYDPLMELLGMSVINADKESVDYGAGETSFSLETPVDGKAASPGNGVHVAFQAARRSIVDEFYKLGLANGGSDDGAPGLRPEYDAHYYGAFIRDPDGNKIEAVTLLSK